ncbi:MAG TPA: RNA polymerase sigma factor [Thermaerobacter sp.]
MAWNGPAAGDALPLGRRAPAPAGVMGAGAAGDGNAFAVSRREATLLTRLRAGDRGAFAELAESWGPRLYRYLVRLGLDPETARDFTQETLVRALQAILRGRVPDRPVPWLYRIATNLVRDDARSAYRQRVGLHATIDDSAGLLIGSDGAAPYAADPADVVTGQSLARDRRAAVRRALAALSPELREVVVLRVFEERPVSDVAAILGVPAGTVKSRLHRALRALRAALEAAAAEPGGEGRA